MGDAAAFATDVEAEFAFGVFGTEIDFSRRGIDSLGGDDEVVNELLHFGHDFFLIGKDVFFVSDIDGAGGEFFDGLAEDADGLADFLDADEVTVVAVADGADGDVEVVILVIEVGVGFADVVFDAGGAEVGAGESVGDGVFFGDDAEVFGAIHENFVTGEEFVYFVYDGSELVEEVGESRKEVIWEVAGLAADAGVGGGEAGACEDFAEVVEFFAFGEGVEEDGHGAGVHGVGAEAEEVGGDASHLAADDADGFAAGRKLPTHEFLDGEGVSDVVGEWCEVVEAVCVGHELVVVHVFGDFFVAAVKVADVWGGFGDDLAVEFELEAQDAVGRGMGRAHVDCHFFAQELTCVCELSGGLVGASGIVHCKKFLSRYRHIRKGTYGWVCLAASVFSMMGDGYSGVLSKRAR